MPTSVIGPLVGPWNVEQAMLATLMDRLPTYLADIERQNGIDQGTLQRPPSPLSYLGGVDFDTFQQDQSPTVIAVAKPFGEPEFDRDQGYGQTYELDVAVIVFGQDEQTARRDAGLTSTAVVGAVIEQGGLGGISQRTRLFAAPRVEFVRPDYRQVARGVCTFHVSVRPIATEHGGPVQTPAPPETPLLPYPTVAKASVTYQIKP